jgi:protein transport protein SEC24
MLYTNVLGQRRIRVFNQSFNIATNVGAYFKAANVETLAQFMLRQNLSQIERLGAKKVKENVVA